MTLIFLHFTFLPVLAHVNFHHYFFWYQLLRILLLVWGPFAVAGANTSGVGFALGMCGLDEAEPYIPEVAVDALA